LWLVEPPRRLAEGEFSLLAGPERIESGWWDGAEARRDYFIARTGKASLAWIYREREGGWFLHGYFA
jgi:protein ImuB